MARLLGNKIYQRDRKRQQKWYLSSDRPRCDCCKFVEFDEEKPNKVYCKFDLLGFQTQLTAACFKFERAKDALGYVYPERENPKKHRLNKPKSNKKILKDMGYR